MKFRRIGTCVELLSVDLSDLSVIREDCSLDWLAFIRMFEMIGVLRLLLVFMAVN